MSTPCRAVIAAALLLAATGCPPTERRLRVDARVQSGGRPLPDAWIIWRTPLQVKRTDPAGALNLILDEHAGLPDLVIHATAGARLVRPGTFTVSTKPDETRHGVQLHDARAVMALDGFDGMLLVCDGLACAVELPRVPGDTCRGDFVFVPADGHPPVLREAKAGEPRGDAVRVEAIAPPGRGAAAYFGLCRGPGGQGPVFASGPYAPSATPPPDGPRRDLQAVLDPHATPQTLLTASLDPREALSDAALEMLQAHLEPREGMPRPLEMVKTASQVLYRQIRDAEGPLPAPYVALSRGVLGRHDGYIPAPRTRSFICRGHLCTLDAACAGRLAFYTRPRGLRPAAVRVMAPGPALVPDPPGAVGVLFAGTCDDKPRFDAAWVDSHPTRAGWKALLAALDDPAHRGPAATILVETVLYPNSLSLGGYPYFGANGPGHAAAIVAPLTAAITAEDGAGRAEALAALDRLAGYVIRGLQATDADRAGFAETTAPALPHAIARAKADPEQAPLQLLGLQAGMHPAAGAVLAELFERATASGQPEPLRALLDRLPATPGVSRALGERLPRALPICAAPECRADLYRSMALHPHPESAAAALAGLDADGEAARDALIGQTPTPELVEALLARAFGPPSAGRRHAAEVLRQWGPPAALEPAMAAAQQPATRSDALTVLTGQHRSPRALGALRAVLVTGPSHDGQNVLRGLGGFDSPEVVQVLIAALENNPSKSVRLVAIQRLVDTRSAPAEVRAAELDDDGFESVSKVARSRLKQME